MLIVVTRLQANVRSTESQRVEMAVLNQCVSAAEC